MTLNGRRLLAFLPLALVAACSPTVAQSASPVPAATVNTVVEIRPTLTVTETVTVTETTGLLLPLGKVFDRVKLEQGVMTALAGSPPAGFGLAGITDVSCPEDQPVKALTSFKCDVIIDGDALETIIVVKDSNGLYEVNPPS